MISAGVFFGAPMPLEKFAPNMKSSDIAPGDFAALCRLGEIHVVILQQF
jgi:hypothetical protein